MSGGGWKKPFERVAAQDSRNLADLFNKVGWQGGEDEAKHNVRNPGRAITKAGINAALWYLGGTAGSELGAGSAGSAAGEGAYDAMTAEQIAQNLAPVAAGENVGTMGGLLAAGSPEAAGNAGLLATSAPQGLGNAMEAGLTDTGYTPSSLKFAFQNANAQNGTSLGQNLGNYGRNAGNNLMNGSTYNKLLANAKGPQGQQLAMKTGMKMLTPQQRPQMAMAPPPQQGQQQPLTNPYQNSLSMGLTEEQKQKLRAMGYPV